MWLIVNSIMFFYRNFKDSLRILIAIYEGRLLAKYYPDIKMWLYNLFQ